VSSYELASLLFGLVVVVPYLGVAERKSTRAAHHWLGAGLVGAALVYIGFASAFLAACPHDEDDTAAWDELWLEAAGLLAYGSCYPLSLVFPLQGDGSSKTRPNWYLLALGWLLHPLWDALLHLPGSVGAHVAPEWYVWACMSFDVVVAAYMIRRWGWQQRGRSAHGAHTD
jgi:hypothetical protein